MRAFLLAAILVAFIAASLFAGQKPNETPKKTPPVLSQELLMKLYQTQAEATNAQLVLEHSQPAEDARQKEYARQAAVKEWTNACGQDWQAGLLPNGRPGCVEKPPTPPVKPAEPAPVNSTPAPPVKK